MMSGTCNYDSILTATDSNIITTSEFYILGHALPESSVRMVERAYTVSSDSYMVLLMFLSLTIITTTVYNSRRSLYYYYQQYFREKYNYAVAGVKTKNFWLSSAIFLFISFLSIALVFVNSMTIHHRFSYTTNTPYWILAVMVVFVVLCFLLKIGIYSVVNWIFFKPERNERWLATYIFISSIFVFPVYLLTAFELFSVKLSMLVHILQIILLIIYQILLIFKLFINFRIKKNTAFFIFLYLCNVELVPTLVLCKTLLWISNDFIEENVLY